MEYQAALYSSGFRAGQGLARNVGTTLAQVTRREEKDSEGELATIVDPGRPVISLTDELDAQYLAKVVTGDNYSYFLIITH